MLRHCAFFLLLFSLQTFIYSQSASSLTLNEAIEKNLLQQPAIRISIENIGIQQGIAQSSAAPFDPLVNSDVRNTHSEDLLSIGQNLDSNSNIICSAAHTNLRAHETVGHFDISKKLREGTVFIFNADVSKVNNPLNCPRKLNTGKVEIGIDQPLLRDYGDGIDRMTEIANLQLIDAVRFDTLQTISQQVQDTTFLYWDTVATRQILDAQKASEERLRNLVEKVKDIIAHKQLSESDLLQPLAQLSSQVVNRIASEQTYFAALQQLKFAIGEWNESCPCSNGAFIPNDEFPFIELPLAGMSDIFCDLFPAVYEQRFDILASQTRQEVYYSLLRGAKNFELPRLDIVGRMSVRDAKSGQHSNQLFSAYDFDKPQKDYTIGVVFSTPIYRDEAKGLIRQRQSQWSQAMYETQFLQQKALADINEALRNQYALQQEVIKAKEAAEEYARLLQNETKKVLAGYSTLFILLSFESSLTNAVIEYIQVQNLFAQNIARLRFLTGTLLHYTPLDGCQSFIVENAATLPFAFPIKDSL